MRCLLNLAVLLAAAALSTAAPPPKPNILLIVADDLGYGDVGFQGCADIPTPNLDRLAAGGVRCSNGYVSYPVCSPSRAGLLTGMYQQRFGYEYNPAWKPKDKTQGLPLDEMTLGDALRPAKYATGIVGKWHLGAHPTFHPNRRGFDEFFGFLSGGHRYIPGSNTPVEVAAGQKAGAEEAGHTLPIYRNFDEVKETGELTGRIAEEAVGFIRRHGRRANPWFLYAAFNAPHTPLEATPELMQRFAHIEDVRRRTYVAMVKTLDIAVGDLLAALDEMKARERTLVFFISDNGGPMTKRNANGSTNTPLRGQKGDVYEGGVRVPFVVSWPGTLPAGKVYEQPVISLDIFPTALDVSGASGPAKKTLDGVSLIPYLKGEKKEPPHERLFWRMDGGDALAVREGRWKWMRVYGGEPQLFDLEKDMGESTDVAAKNPEVASKLASAASRWNRSLARPVFTENPFGGMINRTERPAGKTK